MTVRITEYSVCDLPDEVIEVGGPLGLHQQGWPCSTTTADDGGLVRTITESMRPQDREMDEPSPGSIIIYRTGGGDIVSFSRRATYDNRWVFPGTEDTFSWEQVKKYVDGKNARFLAVIEP